MSDIDRVLQDLLELEEIVPPADIPRVLPALEHACARLWLRAVHPVAPAIDTTSSPSRMGLLTVREVATQLQFSNGHVYELVRSGWLRAFKEGRTIRIPPEALNEWQASHQTGRLDDRHLTLGESTAHDRSGVRDNPSLGRSARPSASRRVR